MLHLSDEAFDRYVNAGLGRTRDFNGDPVTTEWAARFLDCAADAKKARAKRRPVFR